MYPKSEHTEQTSRKCECFTSIFVEMTAQWYRAPCANICGYHPRIFLFDTVETFLRKARNIRQTVAEAFVPKIRSCFWANFPRAVPNLPRSFFLLSLVTFLPFSFSKEKEKESNVEKEIIMFKRNIRLKPILQLKVRVQRPAKHQFVKNQPFNVA